MLGRLDGVADAAIIPGRLTWTLRDDFGQSALDPYTPTTPGNIENINYVTTGPELKLRFDGVNFVDVNLRYGRAQFQTSPFNSDRALASVAVGRDVSAGGSISLNATSERVMFANTEVNGDFTLSSLFGRYELQGARTYFIGELGVTTGEPGQRRLFRRRCPSPSIRKGRPMFCQVRPVPLPSQTRWITDGTSDKAAADSTNIRLQQSDFLGRTDPHGSRFEFQHRGCRRDRSLLNSTPGYLTGGVYRDTYGTAVLAVSA